MAETETPAQRQREIARRRPHEKSSLPAIVLLAGWLVPGLGHLLLGKWVRALLLFAAIVTMYAVGVAMASKVYLPNTGDILDLLGFIAQLGTGLLYVLTRITGWGAASIVNVFADWGTKFFVCAGLLNLIAAVDAHSLANGRKAS